MPQQATPTSLTQRIIVPPHSRAVAVVNAGPQGPRGVVGPVGYLEDNQAFGPLIVGDPTDEEHALNVRTAHTLYGTPPGTVISGIWASPPAGYSFFGVTITDAQTLYPEFWNEIPASWKSGANAVIPPMADSFLMESATAIGTKGGSNTHNLVEANLPPHVHSGDPHTHNMDHDHPSTLSGIETANHQHYNDFNSSTENIFHEHALGDVVRMNPFAPTASIDTAGYGTFGVDTINAGVQGQPSQNELHFHAVQGWTGTVSANHQHWTDIPYHSGNTGGATAANTGPGPGSSTAITHTPAHLKLRFAIRVAA